MIRRLPGRRIYDGADTAPMPVQGRIPEFYWVTPGRTVELPAGRYETIMPPSTVADMMIYLGWTMPGRSTQEGRTALSVLGGGTGVGERLTDLPLTLYSDPAAAGLGCAPFVAAAHSSDTVSIFDNGMDIERGDWIRDAVINALAYPRATAAEFGALVAVAAGNVLMTGGSADLADMIADTERGAAADHAVVYPRG
jgi:predicted Zn-dependent protease